MVSADLRTILQGIALGTAHECAQRCPGGFTERDSHSPDCPSGYGEDAREALVLLEALEAEHAAEVPKMQHFSIVRALARCAMANPNPALRKQVERLRDALVADGAHEEAAAIGRLLEPKGAATVRLIRSGEQAMGDHTEPPTDLDSAAWQAWYCAEMCRASECTPELRPLLDDMARQFEMVRAIAEARDAEHARALAWVKDDTLLAVYHAACKVEKGPGLGYHAWTGWHAGIAAVQRAVLAMREKMDDTQ